MPFDPKCIGKHRNGAHLDCGSCSLNKSFNLTDFGQMDGIAGKITEFAMRLPEWRTYRGRMAYFVGLIIRETCINAVEHGVLGIDKPQKRRLIAEHGEGYPAWLEGQWQEKKVALTVSVCINKERILIGVHDPGAGFDVSKADFSAAGDTELLEPSGRGMAILKGMGVKLYWNKEGNTVLCSFERPSG